jgi:hypothetical protein
MAGTDRHDSHGYRAAAAGHAVELAGCVRQSKRLSYARLVVFLGAAAALLSMFPGPASHVALRVGAAVAGFVAFGVLVWWHSRVEARERWFDSLVHVNLQGAARVARAWNDLPAPAVEGPGAEHPFAGDLDLFGHASLFQLLGWAGTAPGRETLARWLTEPAPAAVVRQRQAAVAELASMHRARVEFAALGRLATPEQLSLDGLLEWADHGPWFSRGPWRTAATVVLPAALLGLFVAQAAGAIASAWWVYPLAGEVAMLVGFGRRTALTFTRVFSRADALERHAELFRRVSDTRFASPLLASLQAELSASGTTAPREIMRLARIGQAAELRRVAILHPLIVLVTLWDFHVLVALERWQKRAGPNLRRWYAALGAFDALAALASLAHDNPSWPFPQIVESARAVDARELAHPLIPEDRRVANDVRVGPPGTFLMVTGSNMSGKSTLLRAVGVNVVLAQAGGPVCAASMTMPPLALATSMRVQDSLEEGVSYFMAAVRRLALVVEAARRTAPGGPMLLYLLDEVLQGTNTAERQVAVRRILLHLLSMPVIGLVTTHDLELAACDELSGATVAVHFSEAVEHHEEGLRLTFDYRLKAGIATSRNALKLLRIVGLDVETEAVCRKAVSASDILPASRLSRE